MIEPDPDVLSLIEEFAVAGISALATAARDAAILPDEIEENGQETLFSGDRNREEQLERASRLVQDTIRREIAITKRISELASKLELKDVVVISILTSERTAERRPESLTSEARLIALRALSSAWQTAEGSLRQAWGTSDER